MYTAAQAPLLDENAFCPVETTLRVVGGKWKVWILFHLLEGPARFNVLRRLIPDVTQRMLTQQLRQLEEDGIVSRTVKEVVPPHVEYAITPLGMTLGPILDAMADWGMAHPELRMGVTELGSPLVTQDSIA